MATSCSTVEIVEERRERERELTSSKWAMVYLGGKEAMGGGVARPLSEQAGGTQFTKRPML